MMLTNDPASTLGQPWFVCAITSFVAIPVWFVGLISIVDAIKPIDNPAGIPIYMMMCLAASVFVVPINTLVIAPALARLAYRSSVRATIVHLIVGAAVFGLLWFWPSMINQTPSLAWTIIPYYLAIFLLPPLLIGSIAYSLRYMAQDRRIFPL